MLISWKRCKTEIYLQRKTNRKSYVAYQMAATAVTLNDLEGHSPLADVFKWNPSNICAAFYTISTDSVLARFLCISRASCSFISSLLPDIIWWIKTFNSNLTSVFNRSWDITHSLYIHIPPLFHMEKKTAESRWTCFDVRVPRTLD